MLFVTSDPHGYRARLSQALQDAQLIDAQENWAGGQFSLWVLGDLVDRGPDGIGTIDLVMRLCEQADDAGGRVGLVLGNHEVLALGMQRFGRKLTDDEQVTSWVDCWQRNGGRVEDQAALTDRHVEWLATRPAMVDVDGHLLMHSDTVRYLEYGASVHDINTAISAALQSDDIDVWWSLLERVTERYDFARPDGPAQADAMMASLGVERMVHGHSIVGDLTGVDPAKVTMPLLYARQKVLAIDGGIYAGGPCFVVNLEGWARAAHETQPS